MKEEQKKSVAMNKKWVKIGLRCFITLLGIYVALFAIRFFQLNFTGKQIWTADSVPRNLVPNLDSEFPDGVEDWENYRVPLQIVDLNGDLEQEFIIYTWSMIRVYRLNSDGRWQYAAGVGFVEKFVYLPFTLWGYPMVLLLDKAGRFDGFFQKID
ncbi:MAG: hypothetical protein IKA22_00815 [Lentisphaeria bacterium]|nr:hypothetical protein [Lentisphaeria bacterium]